MFLQNPRNELPDHFLAFANPTRLRILERLAQAGEVSVNDLAEYLHMSQPRISAASAGARRYAAGSCGGERQRPRRVPSPEPAAYLMAPAYSSVRLVAQ